MKNKPIYIMLKALDPEKEPIHVPVLGGEFVTNKHGFVVPIRAYEGMRTLSINTLRERFEEPKVI